MKASGGFTYADVVISLGMFVLLVAAALPLINMAARNITYAREGYRAHLDAGRLLHKARQALIERKDVQGELLELELEAYAYSVWVVGKYPLVVLSEKANDAELGLDGDFITKLPERLHVIVVVVWDENGSILGRTVGSVFL